MADIAKRLRKRAPHWNVIDAENMLEAATRIEALEAENRQLRAAYGGKLVENVVQAELAAAELRRQHAEIERLYAQRFSAVEDYEKAPDWSLLEATQGALREHMAEIHKLRAERDALRAALKDIADDYEDRFDMNDPSTNPGMKDVVEQARAAIAKAGGNDE